MTDSELVERTVAFVRDTLKGAEGGHDWFHTQRVFRNTLQIAREEPVDLLVVSLAALLHDIADAKFHNGDETAGPKKADAFLKTLPVADSVRKHVVQIVRHISFKNSLEKGQGFESAELHVVRDADRLDALGAIGIARAFNYGGFKNRPLYDPDIPPRTDLTKEAYKKSDGPTLNHFYEKLLLLKDRMHTATGKELAEQRHAFLLQYLEQFYDEWNGRR
ncbi:HD domain-containing protein [Robiginitalea sp. M366]|uniref:HD domain-containing protein n=1 Tax=Robiginitalea aestuariiviva TaxID=3036903 RepID=UPI00240D98DA|nr:HD domain-containing protein [Robiginitalea aestuariiviva]MDG1571346.1 HD domain-containing protein [Robiginitalea aestuariiviva]